MRHPNCEYQFISKEVLRLEQLQAINKACAEKLIICEGFAKDESHYAKLYLPPPIGKVLSAEDFWVSQLAHVTAKFPTPQSEREIYEMLESWRTGRWPRDFFSISIRFRAKPNTMKTTGRERVRTGFDDNGAYFTYETSFRTPPSERTSYLEQVLAATQLPHTNKSVRDHKVNVRLAEPNASGMALAVHSVMQQFSSGNEQESSWSAMQFGADRERIGGLLRYLDSARLPGDLWEMEFAYHIKDLKGVDALRKWTTGESIFDTFMCSFEFAEDVSGGDEVQMGELSVQTQQDGHRLLLNLSFPNENLEELALVTGLDFVDNGPGP